MLIVCRRIANPKRIRSQSLRFDRNDCERIAMQAYTVYFWQRLIYCLTVITTCQYY